MSSKILQRGLLVLVWVLSASAAWAVDDAQRAFEKAHQLVATGDLLEARKSLVTAVKLEGDNQRYLQRYLLVSQAIKFQQAMVRERDVRRWESAAQSLSLFYKTLDLHAQALPIDAAIYQRLKSGDAAVQYCETLLELDQNDRVVEVLQGLDAGEVTRASQAMLSIGLARQGRLEAAGRIVGRLPSGVDPDPFTLYATARAQAAVGANEAALATLRHCYELVPPSRLKLLKSHTKQCSEFAAMASRPTFTQVLRTESKVPESKCSGGTSCSNCPMRGKCSHSQ